VEWDVRVSQPDARAFAPGEYLMHVGVAEPSTLHDSQGKPWAGRANLRTLPLRVRVDTPGTPREVTEALFLQGSRALRRNDPGAALKAFLRAAERNPADQRLPGFIGLAHYRLGNYQAAVQAYKRALLNPGARSGTAVLYLACSYVGLGDEAAAAQVLVDGGMTQPNVAMQLARCRERPASR
jgi:Flp pilus assembly protein TadD